MYLAESNNLQPNSTAKKTNWKSWTCFVSATKTDDMVFEVDYTAIDVGDYRIDFIYEQSNHIWGKTASDKKYDSSKDLIGHITVGDFDDEVKFDGENNVLKRIPIYTKLDKGSHTIRVEVPPNCYFMGIIVRKLVKYTANNWFGADAGKDSGNMMLTSATVSISDMSKPSELQCTIGYDDAFECEDSPSGFYIDYMDEVNFYVKDNDGKIQTVFGGYVSSILPNANRTELTIHCADRLADGQNKYVLDEMKIQDGTTKLSEDEYSDGMTKNFKNYAQALKYLCDIHEVTLKSNISSNNLVEGEQFSTGLVITYGSKKAVKKIPTTNGKASIAKNYVTLRNKPSKEKQQTWTLYDASKQAKTPPNITNRPYMHLTYGLGSPVTKSESKTTETVDKSDVKAGVQKFTKCGVSQDGKYVMFIGVASVNETYKKYGNKIMKRIYENKCPHCGKAELRYDDGKKNGCIKKFGHSGNKTSVPEGEITCNHCDSDFDGVGGKEKITGSSKRLKPVTSPVKSSQKEKDLLISGKLKAVPKTGVEITSDDIFESITKLAFKYKYKRGATGQTFTQMKKSGHGDCWGFSDLIFHELKSYGVTCKIVEYKTGSADKHRSVMYMNDKKQWTDFPYRKYGWDKKYHNALNNTSGSKTGSRVDYFKGTTIGKVKVKSKTTTSKQTTKVTTTKGYDTSKPFQGYLKLTYSNAQSFDAKKKSLFIKFTQSTTNGETINVKGFPVYWINNNSKKSTLVDKDDKAINIIDYIRQIHGSSENVYLQSIQMIAPKSAVKAQDGDKSNEWYTYNDSTHDESSCKMDLYQISFDNNSTNDNSSDLKSCGKSVNSMIQQLVKDTGYLVSMTFGKHRKDDIINFRVNNNTTSSFTASEGNHNNILSWNSISYSPISSLHNKSIQVFKKEDGMYYYVDSRYPRSVFQYGEQTTLQTSNEPISESEAYFNARMSDDFNVEQRYSYTITVPNYPNIRIGDLVTVIANAKKLNSVKEIKSLKIVFDWKKMPRIQTEIGLDELSPDLQLKQNIRNLKSDAKRRTTSFDSSAVPITNIELYEWDR